MEFLLAGPILRNVDPQQVNVWVACSGAFQAKLTIYEGIAPADVTALPAVTYESINTQSIKIGDKLHVCMITHNLTGASRLNPVSLYSYNITFTKAAGGTETLQSLNLLDDSPTGQARKKLALGYTKDKLPTFVLPAPTLQQVQIVHGSCRKPHGPGKDALPSLDAMLKKAVTSVDPTIRPQQLFLTGDQIYADDVATPLMKYITPLAGQLLGKEELLPLSTGNIAINETSLPLFSRMDFTESIGKLTSGKESQNHLIGFGEFCAMYLMAWNLNAWPDEALALSEPVTDASLSFLDNITAALALTHIPQSFKTRFSDAGNRTKEIERRKQQYREELEAVISFRKDIPKVSRAMANIPVYMIMDDHEITDDWYLTKSWRQQVLSSTVGRAVIRNGLLAYSLFQDWGNVPAAYSTSGDKRRLQELTRLAFDNVNPTIPQTSQLTDIENLLGLNSDDTPVKWHFKVATGPTFTLVLDTRTRRQYDRMTSAPGLLKQEALEEQVPTPASLQNPEAILIISPAPVLGMALFEEVVQSFKVKAAAQDFEAWSFNNNAFEKFLDRIQAFKKVILLSGDVHYGFTMQMDYWKKKKSPETGYGISKIVQLVSSACKNETNMVPAPIFVNARINQLQAMGLLPAKRLGWKDKLSVNVTGDVTFGNRMKLKNEPVLLSPGPAWIASPNPSFNTVTPGAEWAWQFDSVMDARPESERPASIRMTVINDDSGLAANAREFYEKVMERHMDNAKKHVSRRFVWNNNLGRISFKKVGGEIEVAHELWHFLADDEEDASPQPYTVYKVNMTSATEAQIPVIP